MFPTPPVPTRFPTPPVPTRFQTPPVPSRLDRAAVVLPARNEADTVAGALEAVGRAVAAVAPEVTCHVVVVDDGSTDGTRRIAARALADFDGPTRVVRIDAGCVGAARRAGVDHLTSTWSSPERVWVLSTDADSAVRPDWIARHLRHACQGALAVSGVVEIMDDAVAAPFRAQWCVDYGAAIDGGRHPYAHATNLGVRLDAYRSVGGFRDLHAEEDADLWQRLRAVGVVPVADAAIVVDTSGRRVGRVAHGFAHALATMYPGPPGADPGPPGAHGEPDTLVAG